MLRPATVAPAAALTQRHRVVRPSSLLPLLLAVGRALASRSASSAAEIQGIISVSRVRQAFPLLVCSEGRADPTNGRP